MWNAMGNCYDKMDKKHEATKCYERAENCKDKEGSFYFPLNYNKKRNCITSVG